jgi:putative ABC transport system permease protein
MLLLMKYGIRCLLRRPFLVIATAAAIALVVFVLAASLMLASGLRTTLTKAGRDDDVVVLQQDALEEAGSRIQASSVALVGAGSEVRKNAQGEALVTRELVARLMLSPKDNPSRVVSVQVRGVSANVMEFRPEITLRAGRVLRPGTDEAMVGSQLLGRYKDLELGGTFELDKGHPVSVVGVFESEGSAWESEVWTDLNTLQTALAATGYVSSVTTRLSSPGELDAFTARLRSQAEGNTLQIVRESAYYDRLSNGLFGVIAGLGGLVGIIFALGAMLGAAITMYGSVSQRVAEIGILRAMGFGAFKVMVSVLVESGGLAVGGATLGVGLALLMPLMHFSTVNTATGSVISFGFMFNIPAIVGSALVGALSGVIGGFFPALSAARLDPLRAIRR